MKPSDDRILMGLFIGLVIGYFLGALAYNFLSEHRGDIEKKKINSIDYLPSNTGEYICNGDLVVQDLRPIGDLWIKGDGVCYYKIDTCKGDLK